MKKLMKVLLIALCAVVALPIIATLVVSPIAQNYIEEHSKELVGRRVKMDKLRINMFTGGLRVENFVMYEANDTADFVSFGVFDTRLRLLPLISRKFIIKRVQLSGADVNIVQNGDKFNFDDIIAHFASDSTETPVGAQPSAWEIGIYNIGIDQGSIHYKDLIVGSSWGLNHLDLKIPGVYFSGKSTDIGLNLDFTSGGALKTALKYDIERKKYNLSLALSDFSMEGLLPYLQQSMNVEKLTGTINADLQIDGNTDHVMDFDMKGSASMSNMLLEDHKGRKVFAVGSAEAHMEEFNIPQERFRFNKIMVDDFSTDFEVYEEGKNNFSELMKSGDTPPETEIIASDSTTASSSATTGKMQLVIRELSVANSALTYTDRTLVRPFVYTVSDISFVAFDFNPDANSTVDIRATMQGQGSARLKWNGKMNDMSHQNLFVSLSNIRLSEFSPYSMQYFGYPIEQGVLTFTSQNVVTDNVLDGTNKLDIYGCELAKRDRDIKPEYKAPLRTGLYILKDKNERINLDLPVKGNIDSPEFSYKKIVIKTLANLMVKVAATPITFLADAMGLVNNQLQSILIDAMQVEFNSEQYAKMQELAEISRSKPDMLLTLTQQLNYKQALEAYAMANLRLALYQRNNPQMASAEELIDISAVMGVDTKVSALTLLADSLLRAKGAPIKGNIQSKAVALYSQKADEQITKSIMARNTLLYSHMTSKLQLPESAFKVESMSLDSMKLYKGKSQYAITMSLKQAAEEEKTE